ncbi:DUF2971 domain-containing protein [Catalinimonas niigatensis]|uniref:DUF2971 domain-containing protein n=1 Tax=Catalinimonas niigatensis TaxID=1397264 RepID=UPI0026665248|nr:DUF2971 domain-containing protein [Catalinimonas niigatensis]WPP49288.1 DUF2971 domain-containing protein [Catalinimonas niigatensis]
MPNQVFLNQHNLVVYNPYTDILYKYVCLDTAKKIIENTTLKFGLADDFNDPFELTLDSIEIKTSRQDLKNFINRRHRGQERERRNMFLSNRNADSRKEFDEIIKREFQRLKNTTGICCFSGQNDIALMWSHYADNHKGICLGFRHFMQTKEFFVIHVNYIKELKPIKYWGSKEELFPIWIFSKSHVWEYEEEIRAIFFDANGFIPFEKKQLCEVHFGLRTKENQKNEFKNLLTVKGYEDISLYNMQVDAKNFGIKRIPY